MILKKINAVIALAAAVLLALHNAINACMMLLGRVERSPAVPARILFILFAVHALVSLFMLILRSDHSAAAYTNVSKGWLLQRITGIAMLPLTAFHAFVQVGQFGERLIPVLIAHFFVMVLAYIHIPLSVPNALVTLGAIDSMKQHGAVRKVCWIICALLFLLGLIASLSEVVVL